MKDLIFAFTLGTGESEKDALRLARSLRTFGGKFCFNPIWIFSQRSEDQLSDSTRQQLYSVGARLIIFELDAPSQNFPFADYVTASAIAEGLAQGEASFLVMLATDTLVLQPPHALVLPPGKSLGACPVHLKLLGSGIDEPIDRFWEQIYRLCRVDGNRIFPMQTIVDEQVVRAYFNAGLLVVRPERGLLRLWKANFDGSIGHPEIAPLFLQNEIYQVFVHQAVLAGTVLSLLGVEEFHQLPFEANYPLHLHTRVAADRRPSDLSQLITCRYEDFAEFFGNPEIDELIQIEQSLKQWLEAQ